MAVQLPLKTELRVFPLHDILPGPACACALGAQCKSIGKHPLVKWRQYDDNLKGRGGGFGIQTGRFNGIFVVDLDVKDGKNGAAALEALAAGRDIPDTLSVITPSGGGHLYFRLPPDVYVPTTHSVLGPGIDIQSEGGYVVGPGSPHKNGGVYQEVPGLLADPPAWLLELVVGQPKAAEPLTTEHIVVDPESPRGVRAVEWAKAFLARAEPAVSGQGGSNRLFAACSHLMYSSLPLNTLRQLVEEVYNPRCEPPWSTGEIEHKLVDADRVFDRPDRSRGLCSLDFVDKMHSRTKETAPRVADPLHEYTFEIGMRGSGKTHKASFGEVCADLFDHKDWAGVLMFNTLRNRVTAVDPPMRMDAETTGLSENDVQLVRGWLEYHDKTLSPKDIRSAIEAVARRSAFSPVQDWLQSLEWDGTPRLDRVLPDYFQSPDRPYERGIGPRWFIATVARAMVPGCQVDCVLVLEGKQGRKKTSAFRALMHDPNWYAESGCGVDKKDFLENLRGIWLMGFDELDSLTRASLSKVKTTLTTLSDHYRKSYGHDADDYPRSNSFCGTTDAEAYLNDPAGARRFWPVKVLRRIDATKIARDRDQIWAEAFARWSDNEEWHVNTPELEALCEEEQETRFEVDSWEEAILRWLNDPTKFSRKKVIHEPGNSAFRGVAPFDGSEGFTTSDVLKHAVDRPTSQQTRADATRVGVILRRLKMQVIRVRVAGGQERRYVFPDPVKPAE